MSDPATDIYWLLRYLNTGHTPHWYDDSKRWQAAITALVAERDALREQLRLANIDQCNTEAEANDRDRDLRERLVCAALRSIAGMSMHGLRWDECGKAAAECADAALAAMRKGDKNGK